MTRLNKTDYTIQDLLAIMRALRDPETGCPWDQVQTFSTIAPYTLEEAYEVADAIARDDRQELCDELGDLLLQVVYHAQMASEQNDFKFDDVVNAICRKMIRRNPHVFGDQAQIDQGKPDWDELKKQERADQSHVQDESALAGVAVGLPALSRARKLQKKASKVNFDWSTLAPVLTKMQEELAELEQAVAHQQSAAIEDELGDVLFCAVNIARHVKLDAELALHKANNKFERRFRRVEALAEQQHLHLTALDEAALEALWQAAKKSLAEEAHG